MSTDPSDNLQSTPKCGMATAETGQTPFLEPNTSYSDSSANSITQQLFINFEIMLNLELSIYIVVSIIYNGPMWPKTSTVVRSPCFKVDL